MAGYDPESSLLQKEFYKCYEVCRNPVRPALHMLKDVGSGVLMLSDAELTLKELPAIHRFMQSKAALQGIHTLILCRAPAESHRKLRAGSGDSDLYSAFAMERGKLLRLVPAFIGKATGLSKFVADNVNLTPEFLRATSEALMLTRSSIRSCSILNCHLGDAGFHAIFPGIAKLRSQCVRFEHCKLTDASVPYLCSIVKSQAAAMDAMYWNSTLRHYPDSDGDMYLPFEGADELYSVHNSGLVALSIASNDLTDSGIESLGRALRKNQWLLGFNFSDNLISDAGVRGLLRALTTNSQCVLQAILMSRPSGALTAAAHEEVSRLTDATAADRARLDMLPSETSKVLLEWIAAQESRRIACLRNSKQYLSAEEEEVCYLNSVDAYAFGESAYPYPTGAGGNNDDLDFEFTGPPECADGDAAGDASAAADSDRPPSRISMRPRHAENSFHSDSQSPGRFQSRSSDDLSPSLVENPRNRQLQLASGSPIDRTLSISLALDERRSRERNKASQSAGPSRSVSPGPKPLPERRAASARQPRHEETAGFQQGQGQGGQWHASSAGRGDPNTLLCSTAASRASSYFYAAPPDRVVHGPEHSNDHGALLQGPLRSDVQRLVMEGDTIRRQTSAQCPKCIARSVAGRAHASRPARPVDAGVKSVIDYDASTGRVIRSKSMRHVSIPRNKSETSPVQKWAMRSGKSKSGASHTRPHRAVKPKRRGYRADTVGHGGDGEVSKVMLDVTSNLQEVSKQLREITCALSESLSLSMSLRSSNNVTATPGQFSQAEKRSISPVFPSYSSGGRHDAGGHFATSSPRSNGIERVPNAADVRSPSRRYRDDDVDEDTGDALLRDSNPDVVSDMIKSSIRKNVAGLFSS
jgi:hypothetical protein